MKKLIYNPHILFLAVILFCLPVKVLAAGTSSTSGASTSAPTTSTSTLKSGASTPPQAFSKEAVKEFADDLFLQGFFDEAENEYRRFLFMSKEFTDKITDNSQSDAIYSLCSIYNLQNKKIGAQWLFNNFFKLTDSILQENLLKLYSKLTFKERNFQDFSILFATAEPFLNNFSSELQFLLPFSIKVLAQDIDAAQKICKEFENRFTTSARSESASAKTATLNLTTGILNENLTKLISQCNSYKTKSPGFALFLSAIFPGAGRWYTGSFRGGFSSFLYIGSFTVGTVYSAIKFGWNDWRPYTFGTVAICFYAAELYGAFKSAQHYNQYFYNAICEQTDAIYEELY